MNTDQKIAQLQGTIGVQGAFITALLGYLSETERAALRPGFFDQTERVIASLSERADVSDLQLAALRDYRDEVLRHF